MNDAFIKTKKPEFIATQATGHIAHITHREIAPRSPTYHEHIMEHITRPTKPLITSWGSILLTRALHRRIPRPRGVPLPFPFFSCAAAGGPSDPPRPSLGPSLRPSAFVSACRRGVPSLWSVEVREKSLRLSCAVVWILSFRYVLAFTHIIGAPHLGLRSSLAQRI